MFSTAITRKPGKNFAQGITTSKLGKPNYFRMQEQYTAYIEALVQIGLDVIELEALPEYPDAYFVEDVAVVTPEVAVLTIPGATARNGEQQYIEPVLSQFREIAHIQPPGTLDGGDVLIVDNHFFVGVSERTNRIGAEQLGEILVNYDYTWTGVSVGAGLHLKSSVNWVGGKNLLLSPSFADRPEFNGYEKIIVDPTEEYACNTLLINNTFLTPKGFPKTKIQLDGIGQKIIELETSEVQKMDGGLTCMSLRF